jgi:hypothetical protein
MIWFMIGFLLLLSAFLCTTAWTPPRCVSERSSDNPGGFDLDKLFELPVNSLHVPG